MASSSEESPDQFNAVLVHEVAHITRFDVVSQLISQLAVAVWWFNPLFWIAARRARLERERACDDAVLAHGERPSDYASHLLAFVRALAPTPMASSHTLSMVHLSQLERRVRSILDAGTNHGRGSRASRLLACALMMGMLPMSAVQLVARTPPVETSRDATSVFATSAQDKQPVIPAIANRGAVATAPRMVSKGEAQVKTPGQAPTPPQQPQVTQPPGDDAKWRAERAEMFGRLWERARVQVRNATIRVEIGTLAPIEIKEFERMLVEVERAAAAAADQSTRVSEADKAAMRQRFAVAMRDLEAAERRFNVGLVTTKGVADAVKAVIDALRETSAITQTSAGAPLANYVIGPDDVLFVSVLRAPEVSGEVRVKRDGKITLPFVSDIVASGLTTDQLKEKVTAELEKLYDKPTVFIQVKEINSRRVYVAAGATKPTPMSDADLVATLRNASTIASDTVRADTGGR